METNGLLASPESTTDRLFIEYGAGRAGLSSYIADRLKSIPDKPNSNFKFIIVDRDTRRRKLDKNFRDEYVTMREKMDISDFNVEKFIQVQKQAEVIQKEADVICIAKHLCGGATDLSLTSLLQRQKDNLVRGVAIATCCHHQCDLKTFCNLEFLKTEGSFTQDELQMLPRFTSWAITAGQTSIKKKIIGFKAKRILDYARTQFIKDCLPDLSVGAQMYCDPITESPECTLIVAWEKK